VLTKQGVLKGDMSAEITPAFADQKRLADQLRALRCQQGRRIEYQIGSTIQLTNCGKHSGSWKIIDAKEGPNGTVKIVLGE
jgi:hypothetical protein